MKTVLAIDHCAKACDVYLANVPGAQVVCGEVRELIADLPYADVILGGPPCQPYSSAGKRAGANDTRDCVPDFCAAVEKVRPRMFLMEEVDAFATDAKFQPVLQRTVSRLTRAGYDVQLKVLDAVNFGVPQFRKRAWLWGVRTDLGEVIARRKWPTPTHAWPWPEPGCMFGASLLPAVVVGEALELDGWVDRYGRMRNCSRGAISDVCGILDAQNDREHGVDRPCGTLQGEAQSKGGGAGHWAIRRARGSSVDRRDHGADEPCPTLTDGSGGSGGILRMVQSHADPARPVNEPASTLRSGGAGHDGCCVRIIGGGSNPRFSGDKRTERDITAEPSTTIATDAANAMPKVEQYRWSDAMREKHPPASPAPTVQAKWYKGGAEGLLSVDGRTWESRHPVPGEDEPMVTLRGRSPRDGGRCTEGVVRHRDNIRRLTPHECARLQSMPDDFVWPESVAKTHRYRIIGNGWASLMAKRMGEALRAADPASETVIDLFCGGGCGAVGFHGRAWERRAAS